MRDNLYFMRMALEEAKIAFSEGEIPIGAIVVNQGKIIGRGHNMTQQLNDVTAHAEMLAITAASESLNGKYLKNSSLYVTLEPCIMCAGAIDWSQISALYFGAHDPMKGYSSVIKGNDGLFRRNMKIESGLLKEESLELLKSFFRNLR